MKEGNLQFQGRYRLKCLHPKIVGFEVFRSGDEGVPISVISCQHAVYGSTATLEI